MSEPPSTIDAEWVKAAVTRFEGPLQQYARRLLGGDAERARDVVQDTFLRLCDQDKGTIDDHLAQWLYTVARNLSLNINRKEKRMTRLSDAAARLRPAETPGPQQVAQQHDEQHRAADLLDALPEHQQEVIRLKFQHGMTYREISKITDHPVSTVGYLITTGLETIRNEMTTPPEEAQVPEKEKRGN